MADFNRRSPSNELRARLAPRNGLRKVSLR